MGKEENSISYTCKDVLERTYTLEIDQDEWVSITWMREGEQLGKISLDGETMERLFQFWRHHVMDEHKVSL